MLAGMAHLQSAEMAVSQFPVQQWKHVKSLQQKSVSSKARYSINYCGVAVLSKATLWRFASCTSINSSLRPPLSQQVGTTPPCLCFCSHPNPLAKNVDGWNVYSWWKPGQSNDVSSGNFQWDSAILVKALCSEWRDVPSRGRVAFLEPPRTVPGAAPAYTAQAAASGASSSPLWEGRLREVW